MCLRVICCLKVKIRLLRMTYKFSISFFSLFPWHIEKEWRNHRYSKGCKCGKRRGKVDEKNESYKRQLKVSGNSYRVNGRFYGKCGVTGSRKRAAGGCVLGGVGGRVQVGGGKDASAAGFISWGRQGEPPASTPSREQTFALRRSTQESPLSFPSGAGRGGKNKSSLGGCFSRLHEAMLRPGRLPPKSYFTAPRTPAGCFYFPFFSFLRIHKHHIPSSLAYSVE